MNIDDGLICPMCKGNNWEVSYTNMCQFIKCWLCSYHAQYMFRENKWHVINYGVLDKNKKEII